MSEKVEFRIIDNTLSLEFDTPETKYHFLNDMKEKGVDFFNDEPNGSRCYIREYSDEAPVGFFKSEHQRAGLAFPSEKLKFFFKERIGLPSDCFMDMGRGYEAQMHFNHKVLPYYEGASMTINQQSETLRRGF
jgi:hypothetical protein